MKIGSFDISNNIILAPMAGVTDHPFRRICREEGCGLVFSEMISARGTLDLSREKLLKLACSLRRDKPIAVQFFGSDPQVVSEAAKIAQDIFEADIIDINMGCPARKILKNKEGAWLMREPYKAAKILEAVVSKVAVPVTVKIRKGWDDYLSAHELAKLAVNAGVKAVSVHGRTVEQGFSGNADWDIVGDLKKELEIAVIGSGDIREPEDVKKMLDYCGCDGVMVGRGALGNPWIFRRAREWIKKGEMLPAPASSERVGKALHHLNYLIEDKGEIRGCKEMRKHAHWYIKHTRGASSIKADINKAKSKKDYEFIFKKLLCG